MDTAEVKRICNACREEIQDIIRRRSKELGDAAQLEVNVVTKYVEVRCGPQLMEYETHINAIIK